MDDIEKLDLILDFICKHKKPIHSATVVLHLDNKNINNAAAGLIVMKLISDGYVDQLDGYEVERNFDGILFNKKGGYKQSIKDVKNGKIMQTWINALVAIGTFLAGIYASVELIKFFYPCFYLN